MIDGRATHDARLAAAISGGDGAADREQGPTCEASADRGQQVFLFVDGRASQRKGAVEAATARRDSIARLGYEASAGLNA